VSAEPAGPDVPEDGPGGVPNAVPGDVSAAPDIPAAPPDCPDCSACSDLPDLPDLPDRSPHPTAPPGSTARNPYPIPRRVSISGGPSRSNLRRRYEMYVSTTVDVTAVSYCHTC